jgi:poly-beta-1,6-N-acetyl-D-glucosamine synthase
VKLLFWLSAFVVAYTYFLYPIWTFCRARFYPRPVSQTPFFPRVTIILAVRNEENHLEEKLRNLQLLDYPRELLETIVVSDGSTDRTDEILKNWKDSSVRSICLPAHVGKAEALNCAIETAEGEIVLFMDARQRVAVDSVKLLTENFADPDVGCASGTLVLGAGEQGSPQGVRSYWNLEKMIRHCESTTGSVVGCTGALYAVRRTLLPRLPAGLILDDVFIPMEVSQLGARVIFDERVLVWDQLASSPRQEFRRKVRTLFGNYQLLRVAPWLLSAANPMRFEFVSHKLCRLAVPFAFIGMLLPSLFLSNLLYRIPLAIACGIGALAVLAYLRVTRGITSRVADLALALVLLNTAAIVALFYFSAGKKRVWVR